MSTTGKWHVFWLVLEYIFSLKTCTVLQGTHLRCKGQSFASSEGSLFVTVLLVSMCLFFVWDLDRNRCWFLMYLTVSSVSPEWHSKHELEGPWRENALSCCLPACRDWGNSRRCAVRITGFMANIWSSDFLSRKRECYSLLTRLSAAASVSVVVVAFVSVPLIIFPRGFLVGSNAHCVFQFCVSIFLYYFSVVVCAFASWQSSADMNSIISVHIVAYEGLNEE